MTELEKKRLVLLPVSLMLVAGLGWAGSQSGAVLGTVPLFLLCAALSLAIQWVAFVPAYLLSTERFFDLTGSLTYLTVTAVALGLSPSANIRSWMLAVLVTVWAARLGSFLFRRIQADGSDGRFDEIRTSFVRFFVVWTLQGVWVCFTAGAALAAIASERSVPIGLLAWLGLVLWVTGFVIEVVSDQQKSMFRSQPENRDKFMNTGLWTWSRHPNYFGEIVLWTGVAIIALPVLQGWQYVTLVSPLFVALLLTKVSGIPMLEARADARWGGSPEYETYKSNTPALWPRRPS